MYKLKAPQFTKSWSTSLGLCTCFKYAAQPAASCEGSHSFLRSCHQEEFGMFPPELPWAKGPNTVAFTEVHRSLNGF